MDKYQKSVEDEAWRGAIKRVGNEIKDYPDNLQNVHTPFKLCSEILEKLNEHVSLGSLGSILCLNLEFVDILVHDYGIERGRIWFLTDCLAKSKFCLTGRYKGINVVHRSFEEFLKEGLDMKFDCVVGNPPYQMNDDGHGASATPLYHKFVEKAKEIDPKHIIMIIPSRWFAGGKGLDGFRKDMLCDKRIKELVDYPNASECFYDVEIKGGVCYFLWDATYNDDCNITTVIKNKKRPSVKRSLSEYDVFIRFNDAASIVQKVCSKKEATLDLQVSPRKPFGLETNYTNYNKNYVNNFIKLYGNGFIGYIPKKAISKNINIIDEYKVLTPKASDGSGKYPIMVTSKPLIAEPGSVCTETYLVVGSYKTIIESQNLEAYLKTKFVRFLISLRKNTQDLTKSRFSFVPQLDMSVKWTDEKLYKRYALSKQEIDFIEIMIKEMK